MFHVAISIWTYQFGIAQNSLWEARSIQSLSDIVILVLRDQDHYHLLISELNTQVTVPGVLGAI